MSVMDALAANKDRLEKDAAARQGARLMVQGAILEIEGISSTMARDMKNSEHKLRGFNLPPWRCRTRLQAA